MTSVNLGTKIEQLQRGYGVRSSCHCVSAFYHCLLSKQASRENTRCLGEQTRVRLCLQKKNCSPERSNGSSSGAYALISPLCRYQAFPSPPINNTRTSHVLKPHLNVLIITPLPVTFHPESKMRSVLKVSLHHYSFASF